MKGIDTNVLVRYLVMDDEEQAKTASACIKKIADNGELCFISVIVLCELIWVLESAYEFPKNEIAGAVDKILATKQFEIESRDVVRFAVNDYREGKGDFADYVIGRKNRLIGCEFTFTFDRSLKAHDCFMLLR
ncbi:MAG: type II toxin-antitoxin system VapC family toxin [Nitrospirae bacterium]|nr:type II toxin-antitoxin system VapC family toxin [Nitrospirota bacterium]